MNITGFINLYLGKRYDLHQLDGINCWGLCALYFKHIKGIELPDFIADTPKDVSDAFSRALATGEHTLEEIPEPEIGCVVLMKSKKEAHTGIYIAVNKVMHSRSGLGVVIQQLDDLKNQNKTHKFTYWDKK